MSQEIKNIAVEDSVLRAENPRDPISASAQDQDLAERALADKDSQWTLAKLAKDMGLDYDFNEIPAVVYQGTRPVVYDGNRRMILAKLKHGYITENRRLRVLSYTTFDKNSQWFRYYLTLREIYCNFFNILFSKETVL